MKRAGHSGAQGSGLMAVLLIMALLAAAGLLAQGELAALARMRAQARSLAALSEARAALLGYAISYAERHPGEGYGYLPCPDAGNTGSTPLGACGMRDLGRLGRLPWRTLGLPALRDGWNECLWYAVAASVKHNPKALALNWDSPGQFLLRSPQGDPLATATGAESPDPRLVAVLLAPGPALETQLRPPATRHDCSGSDSVEADLGHYLDPAYPVSFAGTLEIRQGTSDDTAGNDLLAWISLDDLYAALRRRNDFAAHIDRILDTAARAFATRLDDPGFIASQGEARGALLTGPLPAAATLGLSGAQADAHDNWRDQFRFARCAAAGRCIRVSRNDPPQTEHCRAVLLFGGERRRDDPPQRRLSASERADPAQYFEGINAEHLRDGIAAFAGSARFQVVDPAQAATGDVVLCLN
jgi:hypothetical protein